MILSLLATAQSEGARLGPACEVLGVSKRTVQRWRSQAGDGSDGRRGPKQKPANALSKAERAEILEVADSPRFRGLPPQQIVPRLADEGVYLASESTLCRVFREDAQRHPKASRPQTRRAKPVHRADGPNQLWSWDITYLKTLVKGQYYYLYLIMDVWSRKIVGWEVHLEQRSWRAAKLMELITKGMEIKDLVLHMDNGGPMKGATLLATLQKLGAMASFSRPGVSDDNPYSEALFRTLKYRPGYPTTPFASLEEARAWVKGFVTWYNEEHRHSGIRYLTPSQRHDQLGPEILARRKAVYEAAKQRNPSRWSGSTRSWTPVGDVHLNPETVVPVEDGELSTTSRTPTDPAQKSNPVLPCSTSTQRRPVACGSLPGSG